MTGASFAGIVTGGSNLSSRRAYSRLSGNSLSLGFMPRDSAHRWRVAKTLLSSGKAEGLPLRSSGFSKNRTGNFFLILEVLQQSSDLELVWRDSSLNAHKVVRQPFLKIVEESSQIHIHVPITRGVHISNGVLEYWSAGVSGFESMTPLLHHSSTPIF